MKTFTLADTFNDFTEELVYSQGRTQKTVIAYTQSLRVFQRLNNQSEFTAAQLHEAVKRVAMSLAKEGKIKKTSINVTVRSFNSFFSWLQANGYCNEHLKVKLLKQEKKVIPIYTDEDIKKLIHYKPKSFVARRAWTMAMLILDCGPRIDEVINLRREDVDLDNCQIVIVKGKGQKGRRIPFSMNVRSFLYKYIRDFMPEASNLVFGTNQGTPVTHRNASADLQRIGAELKLSDILRFHQLRHTFGTIYIRNGGEVAMLKNIMGHSSISTTMMYVHSNIQDLGKNFNDFSPLSRTIKGERRARTMKLPNGLLGEEEFMKLMELREIEPLDPENE